MSVVSLTGLTKLEQQNNIYSYDMIKVNSYNPFTLVLDTQSEIQLGEGNYASELTFLSARKNVTQIEFFIRPRRYIKYCVPLNIITADKTETIFIQFECVKSVVKGMKHSTTSGNFSFKNGKYIGPASAAVYTTWDNKQFIRSAQNIGQGIANQALNPSSLVKGASTILNMFLNKRKLGDLKIDCTFQEDTIDEWSVTQHPVEIGSTISDHVYRQPIKFTIKAGFFGSSLTNTVRAIKSLVTGQAGSLLQQQYTQVLALQEAKETLTIVTKKRTYKNMFPNRVTVMTDKDTENVMNFTVECTELIKAKVTKSAVTLDKTIVGNIEDALNKGASSLTDLPAEKLSTMKVLGL